MTVRNEPPQRVRTIEHAWIPMPDGVRLAARIWIPESAAEHPVPAVLEYIPYRKRDWTSRRDETMHRYFAQRGYAAVRADLRGFGDSEGVLDDEYLPLELDDGVRILEWIADQPWCDGSVGMMGLSWGGFNGLQIAALRPTPLRAVVTVCSSDDRYADDVHYMGGCLLGDNLSWASTMLAYVTSPPDPQVVGDRWRTLWRDRLEHSGLWLEKWLEHQHRDAYWQHASVCEDYSDIRVPVLAAGGWADGYTNAVFRLLENLDAPTRGLVGPWSHRYPHLGQPGPAIGFLQECLRWWDRWLRDEPSGADDAPALRAYMLGSSPPYTSGDRDRPGRWIAEEAWPSDNITPAHYRLTAHGSLEPDTGDDNDAPPQQSADADADAPRLTLRSPLSTGLLAGKWCSYATAPDLPGDQREADGGSLVFETEPLEHPLEILGRPTLDVRVSSDKPVAMLAARLSDVRPDHSVTRSTFGLLNLTHRDGHEHPAELPIGRPVRARILLNAIGQSFPVGHRVRLSLSSVYWPLAWPAPEHAELTIHPNSSRLTLPARRVRTDREPAVRFDPPEHADPACPRTVLRLPDHSWTVRRDLGEDLATLHVVNDRGATRIEPIRWTHDSRAEERYSFRGDDLATVKGETEWDRAFTRDDLRLRVLSRTILTADRTDFHLHADVDAFENDRRVYTRAWDRSIPRRLA